MATIEELRQRFVEVMGNFSKEVGFVGAAEGRLLGQLILADEPQTQDDLMALSSASRGAVSTALRTLIDGGFVRRTSRPGSRRDYYEAQADLWRITIRFVLNRIGGQIETVHAEFTEIMRLATEIKASDAPAAERRNAARLLTRVERFSTFTRGAENLLGTVKKLVDRQRA